MEKLKRSLSFRKKKDHVPECSKPHQWQEDERKVREGTCSFQVRYLGCIEVFESRGMQVCEEAVKALKARQNRSVWSRMSLRKKKKDKDKKRKKGKEDAEEVGEEPMDLEQCKGKYQRAILYVSGDALRVVDEISKGLIVDQTIEKVSFCAPDRNHEKGFAYICRDGTTRRWMCHGFLALKESGERLSHAVGCAFAICLEKKQKREKDAVVVQYNEKGTSFTRTGSFRQATLTERLADPQSTILAGVISAPVPQSAQENPFAVSRPHASQAMLYRQGSFRGFQKLNESSPFKRQLSLRLNELPSTLQRQQDVNQNGIQNGAPSSSPIPEASPTKENADTISEMCQQLTQGLSALATSEESYNSPPRSAPPTQTSAPMHQFGARQGSPARQPPQSAHSQPHPTQAAVYTVTAQGRSIPLPEPIRQNNPWAGVSPTPSNVSSSASTSGVSDADAWLNTTASSISQQPAPQDPYAQGIMNGVPQPAVHSAVPQHLVHHQPLVHQQPVLIQADPFGTGAPYGMIASPPSGAAVIHHRAPHLTHLRSHSIDTADMWANQHQRAPTLRELSHVPQAHFQSQQQNGNAAWHSVGSPPPSAPPTTNIRRQPDPFEAAWAAKSTNKPNTNPFQSGDSNVTKAFEVKL